MNAGLTLGASVRLRALHISVQEARRPLKSIPGVMLSDADGTRLTIDRLIEVPDMGEFEQTLVFTKREWQPSAL